LSAAFRDSAAIWSKQSSRRAEKFDAGIPANRRFDRDPVFARSATGSLKGVTLMEKIMAWGVAGDLTYWEEGKNLPRSLSPVPGPGLPFENAHVLQLAAGFLHNLVLLDDGKKRTVWAWGDNFFGQLGNNSRRPSTTLVQVVGEDGKGWLEGVDEIAAGFWHSLARKGDTVFAWGNNFWGQLGNGERRDRQVPVRVGKGTLFKNATIIAAGCHHSLAITTGTESGVWAWGLNLDCQLGPGTKDDHSALPLRVFPKGASNYVGIAGGLNHSLALDSDGVVWAWGGNLWGQFGDGTTSEIGRADPVQGLKGGKGAIVQIAAGYATSFAINNGTLADKDAGVWAWGFNGAAGELGDGTTALNRPNPVQVVGPLGQGLLTNVSAISVGAPGTTLARRGDATVWAWGNNGRGELGDGTTTESRVPKQVVIAPSGVAAIEHIAAGWAHSLAGGLILP
jgi:alpha-tubulin suppressor-like RCC1 family protein